MDIEAFHTQFFNVIARVIPGLEDLHYGLAAGPPPANPFGILGRLKEGSRRLMERISGEAGMNGWPEGSAGLDVGCGLGGAMRFLVERHGFRMRGLNINRTQVRLAVDLLRRKGLSESASLTVGDAQRLPFGDASFRFALLIEVAFHVRGKEDLFAELARVLEPGGRVLLVDQELSQAAEVMGLFFFVGFGEYQRLAERAGLRLVKEVDLTREVAWWMTDYVRAASWPFHAGALVLALLRGGVGLARQYAAGVRAFQRLIVEDFSRRGHLPAPTPFFNGIRALRAYTKSELESRRCLYKLLIFEKPIVPGA